METIKKTAELFKLPENLVRSLVKKGSVISVRCGANRFLVNCDRFAEYINTNTEKQLEEAASNIRKIELRR
jgi:hypothetical protein